MNARQSIRLLVIGLVFLSVICLDIAIVNACPTCKYGMAGHDHLIRGYFWSIVFMMSMPFLLLSSFAAYFYYLVRKARGTGSPVEQAGFDLPADHSPFDPA